MKSVLLAAATAAVLAGGAAQAHGYGGHGGYDRPNLPAPPYAQDGRSYAAYERVPSKGFPLVGADAGVTVLGVHVGGSAKIRIGLDEELREKRYRRVRAVPAYAPPAAVYAPPACNSCDRW